MTKTQAALVAAMKAALDSGEWELYGRANSIRFKETVPTPEALHGTGFGRWPHPEYDRLIFITIVTGKPWSIILRVCRAPWIDCIDRTITFKRAFAVLADPVAEF